MQQKIDSLQRESVKKLLILYELHENFIGDSCRRFAKLKRLQDFFLNAIIEVNSINYYQVTSELLKNNQFVDSINCMKWSEIKFENYDLIVSVSNYETKLAEILKSREITDPDKNSNIVVCSVSVPNHTYPQYDELNAFLFATDPSDPYRDSVELHLDQDELNWSNQYLSTLGITDDESLTFYLDTSTSDVKVLPEKVSLEAISYFAKFTRLIIFDELGKGKKEFYRTRLTAETFEQIIFIENFSLRLAISLLGSKFTKIIFGPSTGLLHCASGIYRNFIRNGMPIKQIPVLLVYLGLDPKGYDEWTWWGDSLATCMIVKSENGKKIISKLGPLNQSNLLPCCEYPSTLMLEFVKSMLHHKLDLVAP